MDLMVTHPFVSRSETVENGRHFSIRLPTFSISHYTTRCVWNPSNRVVNKIPPFLQNGCVTIPAETGGTNMLGERIALLRRGLGWNQSDLARRLHISTSAVGMYEQGRREPSLSGLVELAGTLGVSADYLLTGKPLTQQDTEAITRAARAPGKMGRRNGLSREELTVLLSAVLTQP